MTDLAAPKVRTLGAVLYPGFELLDYFGPLEMFGSLPALYRIVTIAEQAGAVASTQGPKVIADVDFASAPHCDLILVPGGAGTLPALHSTALLGWLRERAATAEATMSVCTGSALLARAGVLDGLRATSNKQFFDLARAQSSAVQWVESARWVDAGAVVTSSGVSAGMDMALAVIARLHGEPVAQQVADLTEYQWHRDADVDPFARFLDAELPNMAGVPYKP